MPLSKISKCILTPSRLAAHLKWNPFGSTLMALDISQDTLGIAWTKLLPFQQENDNENDEYSYSLPEIQSLDSIPFITTATHSTTTTTQQQQQQQSTSMILEQIVHTIHSLVEKESIQGFIIGWPLLQPYGQVGYECGRVLYLLDFIMNHTKNKNSPSFLIHPKQRPLTLWDKRCLTHNLFLEKNQQEDQEKEEDAWKRFPHLYCPNHTTTSTSSTTTNDLKMDMDPKNTFSPHEMYYYSSKNQIYSSTCNKNSKECATILLQQFITTSLYPQEDTTIMKKKNTKNRTTTTMMMTTTPPTSICKEKQVIKDLNNNNNNNFIPTSYKKKYNQWLRMNDSNSTTTTTTTTTSSNHNHSTSSSSNTILESFENGNYSSSLLM